MNLFPPIPGRRLRAAATAAAVVAAALLAAPPSSAVQADERQAERAESPSMKFLRFEPTADGGLLETSIVRYRNDAGTSVDLIGAVHVGDAAYYDLLNERFAAYDVLLYEMVMPKGADPARRDRPNEDIPMGMQLIGGLQKAVQMALDLEFQTDAIDYAARNFVHADLDLETFTRLQSEQGEGFLDIILGQMMEDLLSPKPRDGKGQPQVTFFEIMEAMEAPDSSRRLKLLFARELSRMDDMMAVFDPGGDGSVILDVRNERALEVLDEVLEEGRGEEIGIFYGAAHLKGMEELLLDRGFEQVGEPEFLVAWDMTLDGSGRRAMREKMRDRIVRNAVGGDVVDRAEADGGGEAGEADLMDTIRAELDALRRENEALRRQLDAVRRQNEALRERAERE